LVDISSFESLFKRWSRSVALSAEDRHAFASLPWTRREVSRDAYLAREGEPTKVCSLLLYGLAFRQKLLSDGSRQIISFHIAGELLDVQNCALDVADHNVQALTRCIVLTVRKDELLRLMDERSAIRHGIWIDSLVDSSIFREWVVNVGRRHARERVAHLLCELAARLKAAGLGDGPTYDFPITQEQIADATGMTAVHTNRTLQSLRKSGLIRLSSSKLTIIDWRALAEVGDFGERYLHNAV
jgi:CRP-like cAMP-binding protein